MIGIFFFFNLQRNTGFIEIMMWHGFIGWRKTLVLYQLQEKLLVPPRGPLMWSSLLLPAKRKVPHGYFFWLSSTSSLPINLTIVNKTKPRLKLSSTYPQSETQNQSQNQNFSQTHLPLSFSLPLALFPQYLSKEEIPPLFVWNWNSKKC